MKNNMPEIQSQMIVIVKSINSEAMTDGMYFTMKLDYRAAISMGRKLQTNSTIT